MLCDSDLWVPLIRLWSPAFQVPLVGSLASGGIVFVMKGESGSQPTHWLKDGGAQSDFFIDVQQFPMLA